MQVLNPYPAIRSGRTRNKPVRLTGRELETLRLVAEGHESKEAAEILCVSKRTVDFHLSSVYRKLGANNRIRAVSTARKIGILPIEM